MKEQGTEDWSDFIGCIEAEPDLSQNYKTYLTSELKQKYDHFNEINLVTKRPKLQKHFPQSKVRELYHQIVQKSVDVDYVKSR